MAKILICDDDPAILELLTYQLEKENHECTIAKNGLAGYHHTFDVDLIITDLMMPMWTGDELIECTNAKFVVLTAYSDEKRIEELKNNAKVVKVIKKPWGKEELLEAVNTALLG